MTAIIYSKTGTKMAMNREDVLEKVVEIIAEKLSVEVSALAESSDLKDIGADSLDLVELIMSFEEFFNIEINDEEAENIKTVGQAVDLISKNISS
jgi:acyl carrier protein